MADVSTVQRIPVSTIGNGNDTIGDQAKEAEKIRQQVGDANKPFVLVLKDGTEITYRNLAHFDAALKNGGDKLVLNAANADASSPTQQKANELMKKMEELAAKLKNETDNKEAKAELAKALSEAMALKSKGGAFDEARLNVFKELSGGGGDAKAMKAMVHSNSSSGGGTASGTTTAGGAKAQTMTSSFPPSGWGAQTTGGAAFSSDAYMQSIQTTDSIMASWDEISSNQKKGKQLMQLFFYFAKMAESGDMGAMYQFMKFITYIISKDKAKQQIEMGKKLIELQDLSREWTNKLTGLSTSTDSSSSNELMKTMTLVKSETDAIATSQKLISQMMEEFAQVVETLTNTTKSALETNGRIQRTVSRFSA